VHNPKLVLLVTIIPGVCLFLGALLASFHRPGEKVTSAVQHFAAGIVFAAVAVELLPLLGYARSPILVAIGFILGVALMLVLKHFATKAEQQGQRSAKTLAAAIGIDVFIDGLLIGIALLAGLSGGVLIAIALSVEIFFLGLTLAITMGERNIHFGLRLITAVMLMLLLPIGGLCGTLLLAHLPDGARPIILSFGVAALLYLVTEELLVEAHEKPDTPWLTAFFFLGFLGILLLGS